MVSEFPHEVNAIIMIEITLHRSPQPHRANQNRHKHIYRARRAFFLESLDKRAGGGFSAEWFRHTRKKVLTLP
ncbi:MAG: hypothetical protein COZ46_05310 [Verrucomicrobia bacterium CG_4_10_14_3_um_filter_43_23]|nr:MAG: hypothetical protein AUJ82_08200 [Verrucomicrobia bacterium CG1_02_43_26]PIP59948.1 MAG: hypothetical protein COX01_00960 [Verrucomicrobia bacterium CG22_combo_CG10-13_8_21_14_all_43_17]PIX58142.1 MAG: hypothetical protein COZ46_05310 [Verrucomicrobia bacterium CG_4_10_14_3_um_filter_43_23]PIY61859.1 MAG: hypothetical protein COY94_03395 [Verrucomicrobia bacterium CG_4_10_14_0_8_um_filter_43_34]PJA44480.1 MAG: hypothetical protein CO175_02860 [Verrucomicrobia bacterium CG_4_9_14_3_um_fi